jgi:hypothetical protein
MRDSEMRKGLEARRDSRRGDGSWRGLDARALGEESRIGLEARAQSEMRRGL